MIYDQSSTNQIHFCEFVVCVLIMLRLHSLDWFAMKSYK